MAHKTRADKGCIQFEIHENMDKPGEFILWEHFVGKQALDDHLNKSYSKNYFETTSVINISSYFSHRMLQGRHSTAYSLTKGTIEMGKKNTRVNAIAPGTIDTPLVESNINKLDDGKQKFHEMIKTIYPLGRIGKPEDLGSSLSACRVKASPRKIFLSRINFMLSLHASLQLAL
ncbi:SDR family oxidoreductase [Candidatus Acidulodesulfobacterium sp. H_13]|uniref:SDR family oxidoreductase n=1 Tax=Candidatus Acidulodesulfobacterium sp. H_13 TaxID=3395470 RepID=UPI003AF737E0